MIRILYRHRSGTIVEDCPLDQLQTVLKDPHSSVWIDLSSPTVDEYTRVLVDIFHFHPLAVEDAIQDVHIPKLDDYAKYLYLVFHTFALGDEYMDIDSREIDIFLGANYLITGHVLPSNTINNIWNVEYHKEKGLSRGVALLLYELLDTQLDSYIPLLDQFEDHVEGLGDTIFTARPRDDNRLLNSILTAKTSALRLHRIITPQREVLNRLARGDSAVIPHETRIYFSDVYDHLVRLADLVDSMRDLVNSTLTTYLSITNNRLNEIMKVLTVISTIFIPLSFLAAVYGMNFRHMPELNTTWAYPAVWASFFVIAGGMLFYFRRRHWL
ncbi:MAG: magnesium/cobalt transporter CorA [Caldilineaceae bacterium]|jgi:magnesium transporter